MKLKKSSSRHWTHYALNAVFLLGLRLAIGALVIASKLKSLMAQDSMRQAALLILLLVTGLTVSLSLLTLLSSDSQVLESPRLLSM